MPRDRSRWRETAPEGDVENLVSAARSPSSDTRGVRTAVRRGAGRDPGLAAWCGSRLFRRR